jgi:hypothetical protein
MRLSDDYRQMPFSLPERRRVATPSTRDRFNPKVVQGTRSSAYRAESPHKFRPSSFELQARYLDSQRPQHRDIAQAGFDDFLDFGIACLPNDIDVAILAGREGEIVGEVSSPRINKRHEQAEFPRHSQALFDLRERQTVPNQHGSGLGRRVLFARKLDIVQPNDPKRAVTWSRRCVYIESPFNVLGDRDLKFSGYVGRSVFREKVENA